MPNTPSCSLARAQHGAPCRRLTSGEWIGVFQGAYRLAGVQPTWEQTVMAGVLAAGSEAVASHRAAGTLFGMPGVPRWVEVTVSGRRRVQVEGIIAHRVRLLVPGDAGEIKGIPVTTPGRTIADLARIYSKGRLGPMLDYAQAQRLVTRAEMEARATGRRHDDILREMLDERPATARPMGSEFEACLFRGLREAGLPLPQAQYRVLMTDGSEVFPLPLDPPPPITYDLVMRNRLEVARRVGRALESRLVARDLG